MIFDSKLMFNARTSGEDVPMELAGTGTTVVFTDIVDLKGAHTLKGKPAFVGIRMVKVASTVTAGITCQFSITHCATVDGTYTQCGLSAVYESAVLVPGFEIKVPLSEGILEFVKCSTINVGAVAASQALAGLIL
ncbi:MAG: hypothetical protein PF638_11205 [Candidatus Delongbacteria bacterium]|jgi:hypothetical protein|nr:hypothetical protein [Candidatus Delongbacteria bacterium]